MQFTFDVSDICFCFHIGIKRYIFFRFLSINKELQTQHYNNPFGIFIILFSIYPYILSIDNNKIEIRKSLYSKLKTKNHV